MWIFVKKLFLLQKGTLLNNQMLFLDKYPMIIH